MLFPRGLRAVTRRDGVARLCLPAGTTPPCPEPLALTLSPRGVSLLLDEADLPPALPEGAHLTGGLCLITAFGVGMGGGEDLARRILLDLARAGIMAQAVSLCDLGLAFAVDAALADAAMDTVTASVPLTP